MKFGCVAAIALAVSCLSSNAYSAGCSITGRYLFGEPSMSQARAGSGQFCRYSLWTSGAFKSLKIVSAPRNGMVKTLNIYTVGYQSKPGFKGQDSFTLAIDGVGQRSKGVTDMTVTVKVE